MWSNLIKILKLSDQVVFKNLDMEAQVAKSQHAFLYDRS